MNTYIKNFYKIIILGSLGFNYFPLNAEETWIEINEGKMPPSVITSSQFEGYSYVNYLDLKSLVKKNDITYFNWNMRLKKPNGILVNTDFDKSKKGGRINCKDKTVYFNNSFTPINEDDLGPTPYALWGEVYSIVCEKKINPKWIEINEGKLPPSLMPSSKFEGYGYVNYLDLKSFVKKKDITYFNWNTRLKKPNGTLVNTDFKKSKKRGKINCKEKTVYLNNSFTQINEDLDPLAYAMWSEIYPKVCKKNNFKWKFW